MNFVKKGLIWKAENVNELWKTHTMAPSAILVNESTIRVYVGGFDDKGISRIWYLDLDSNNPSIIKSISKNPVLDIGEDGCFDDNGVFPAHISIFDKEIYLNYTGFQLGKKSIEHFNFGGLAKGFEEDSIYKRVSKVPILDRSDEGLFVRAGQSIIKEDDHFLSVYSAGNTWSFAGGKMRPNYDICIQKLQTPLEYSLKGEKIIYADHSIEHGLGRPQIIKLKGIYYVFYTRRLLNMKYFFGISKSTDLINWIKIDDEIKGITHSESGWDSEMIYFPSVIEVKDKIYMFYSGNNFGLEGFGYSELEI